jgi:hypothetical protein
MATAPTVQTLDEIMASLQPGYAAQQGIIGEQIANTDATAKAQKLALDAAKTKGFNQINDQATGKGTTFSGMPTTEQADYLSTTYLPGIQKTDSETKATKLTLAGQAAELNTDQRKTALNVRENQVGAANTWNLNERNIAATAAENAANRAATAAAAAAQKQAETPSLKANIRAYLDQYVDPATGSVPKKVWANAAQLAKESGMGFGGDTGFASTFWNYADDAKWQDYKLGYDRYL